MDYIEQVPIVQNIEEAVKFLKEGKAITRYEYGDSMTPILFSGEYARVRPIKSNDEVTLGDAVLCDVDGNLMIHMVLDKIGNKFLIAPTNPPHFTFGFANKIYGIAETWKEYIGKRIFKQ